MTNKYLLSTRKKSFFLIFLFSFLFLSACVSHLKEAKYYYAQGQKFSRSYQTEKAVSSFKRALREAELEAEKHASAQAYMLKGMVELELELWEEAEESFVEAFSYGFEKAEAWAEEVSLLGLALSFQELGLEDSAFKIYAYLVNKSKLKGILQLVSQRYTDMLLERALHKKAKEGEKSLAQALKSAQRLANNDLSYGFYHYLLSQIYSHLSEHKNSFEEAVMAKELGLPTEKIFRDNDLQIIFCYQKLKENMSSEEWEKFHSSYLRWVKKWNWQDPETPGWKKR